MPLERIPRCQRLVLEGTMFKVRRIFLRQPIRKEQHLLFTMAQIIISRHSDTTGGPLVNHTGLNQPGGNRQSYWSEPAWWKPIR